MFWNKVSRIAPPADIPVYVVDQENCVKVKIFSESDLKNLLDPSQIEDTFKKTLWDELGQNRPDLLGMEEFLKDKLIFEHWSFIPLLPPDEIFPFMTSINNQLTRLQEEVKNLRKEICNIPRITSFAKRLDALQMQIAKHFPDTYHQSRVSKLKPLKKPLKGDPLG